jgi:hypothetical protein
MKDHPPRSRLDILISKLPYPLFSILCSSFAFVWLLGLLFGRGFQIYPPPADIPPEMDCPECRIFHNVSAQIKERQYRIIYEVKAKLELTRTQAWRLLRLKVHGPFFEQELRAEDNCGVYTFMRTRTAHHFPLIQEGSTIVELYCIDQLLLNTSGTVEPWSDNTEHSVFHRNGTFTNVCTQGQSLIGFAPSRVFPARIPGFASVAFHRTKIGEYDRNLLVRESGFSFGFRDGEMPSLSWKGVMERVLLPAFAESEAGATITFRNDVPEKLGSLMRRVTAGRYTEAPTVCYRKLTVRPDVNRVAALGAAEYANVRERVAGKYTNRTQAIVVNLADVISPLLRVIPHAVVFNITDYKDMIKSVAVARAMLSVDDDNAVLHAFWLPPNASLLLVLPPKRGVYSSSISRLMRMKRTVIPVWGEVDGAISPMPELLAQCLNGTLDANSADCDPAYRNLSYHVNPGTLADAIAGMNQ